MKNTIEKAQAVCDLIQSEQGTRYKKFNRKQKIDFAYKYWTSNSEDITELYGNLAEYNSPKTTELAKTIADFIDYQGITPIRRFGINFFNQKSEDIQAAIAKVKINGNWLSQYDLEREFTKQDKSQNPIRYSYLKKDGSILIIDKEKAHEILGILIDENIPTAKCIVTGSFMPYANGSIDEYVKTLQKIKTSL